jgi:hypothetical protein
MRYALFPKFPPLKVLGLELGAPAVAESGSGLALAVLYGECSVMLVRGKAAELNDPIVRTRSTH